MLKVDAWVEVVEGPAANLPTEKERQFKIRKTHMKVVEVEGPLAQASPQS